MANPKHRASLRSSPRLRQWLFAFSLSILWQGAITVLGLILFAHGTIHDSRLGVIHSGVLSDTYRWDGWWYLKIEQNWYTQPSSASFAFYPLFPAAVWFLCTLSGGLLSPLVAGLVVNTLALAAIIVAMLRLAKDFRFGGGTGWILVVTLLTAPMAWVLHEFYSDALYLAVGLWAYHYAKKQAWGAMGVLLFFASASRVTGLVVLGMCGLEYLRAKGWLSRRVLSRDLLWFLLGLGGFIGFALWSWHLTGNPLYMAKAVVDHPEEWPNRRTSLNLFGPLLTAATQMFTDGYYGVFLQRDRLPLNVIVWGLPLVSLLTLLGSILAMRLSGRAKEFIPLAAGGLVSFVVFTATGTSVNSTQRYVFETFGILLAFGAILDRWRQRWWLLIPLWAAGAFLNGYILHYWLLDSFLVT